MDRDALDESYRRRLQALEARTGDQPNLTALDVVVLIDGSHDVRMFLHHAEAPPVGWTPWLACTDESAYSLATELLAGTPAPWKAVRVSTSVGPDGSWLPPGACSHVVLMDGRLTPAFGTLQRVIPNVIESNADWTYTDDDCVVDGLPGDPYLKGGCNLALLAVDDYAARVAVVRRSAIERVGGLRSQHADAQLYELCLRMSREPGSFQHVAAVCGRRTSPVETTLNAYHHAAATRELFGTPMVASIRLDEDHYQQPRTTVVWQPQSLATQAVTIVIPTRDRLDLLQVCIESLRRTISPLVEILVVDDFSDDPRTHAYLDRLASSDHLRCRITRPEGPRTAFNYAALMNHGAKHVTTPLMLHLNNDIEAITPGWLEQMVGWLSVRDVGAVGARLVYPDGSIQHAGVVVSPADGALAHFQHGLAAGDPGYHGWPNKVRDVSAVTGACLLTRTTLFADVGGFDQDHFSVQFNDIDYCLRLRQAGHRIVYEPAATLIHRASASRGQRFDYAETLYFLKKYRNYTDPFISPLLNPLSLGGTTPTLRM